MRIPANSDAGCSQGCAMRPLSPRPAEDAEIPAGRLRLMGTMNYYVVLGIEEDADSTSIRRAFRALARRYHPDAGAGSSAIEFRRVLEAYETLSDPDRRRLYDRRLGVVRGRPAVVVEWSFPGSVAEPLFDPRLRADRVRDTGPRSRQSMSLDDMVWELFAAFSAGYLDRRSR
jgi:curved DNA-binding protein CbpA